METAEADKINPGKPHTDTATTSKVAHPDDDQNSAKDTTKEAYQGDTESLSSNDPPVKDNSDDEDFQSYTSSLENDAMTTSKVMRLFPDGIKGRIKVRFKIFFKDQTLHTYNKNT